MFSLHAYMRIPCIGSQTASAAEGRSRWQSFLTQEDSKLRYTPTTVNNRGTADTECSIYCSSIKLQAPPCHYCKSIDIETYFFALISRQYTKFVPAPPSTARKVTLLIYMIYTDTHTCTPLPRAVNNDYSTEMIRSTTC
jgi:hypothetical protein